MAFQPQLLIDKAKVEDFLALLVFFRFQRNITHAFHVGVDHFIGFSFDVAARTFSLFIFSLKFGQYLSVLEQYLIPLCQRDPSVETIEKWSVLTFSCGKLFGKSLPLGHALCQCQKFMLQIH